MKKLFSILFFLLLNLSIVSAATIYGSVYDLSITKLDNAVLEINTIPNQRRILIDGSYEFEVSEGDYTITAYYANGMLMKAEENITIKEDGEYILDMFLYPDFSDEESLYDDLDLDIYNPYETSKSILWLLIPLACLMFVFLIFLIRINTRLQKKEFEQEIIELDEELHKILKILKKNNGRMTQKEIRKEFPLSEAKISLMIAELESMGKVKKIKKGRGNIIVIKK